MITDQDVAELYRCLLGRAPESPDTVAAFKSYYPDFARGRRAILQSAEFTQLADLDHGAQGGRLALAFLRRAGSAEVTAPAETRPGLQGAMRLILRGHGAVRAAVVVGEPAVPLADLLPLDTANAAILHITAAAPAGLPRIGSLPGGSIVFRLNIDAPELAGILDSAALKIDVLAVFGGAAAWFGGLRGQLSQRAILMGDTELPAGTAAWPDAERELSFEGLHARFLGGWFLPVLYAPPEPPARLGPIDGLCIAAIMRNEEGAGPNMLASADPVASSFVVVDTGSTDATVARVEACLKAIGKPFVMASQAAERFDDMRNAALDLVPPQASWVLMLDADEELCPEDHAALRALLQHADRDAYALPRYNYTGADKSGEVTPYPDRQVRLLRNTPDRRVRYSGAVHETIRGVDIGRVALDAGAIGLDRGGPHIHHLVRRYRTPEAEARKQENYRQIAATQASRKQD